MTSTPTADRLASQIDEMRKLLSKVPAPCVLGCYPKCGMTGGGLCCEIRLALSPNKSEADNDSTPAAVERLALDLIEIEDRLNAIRVRVCEEDTNNWSVRYLGDTAKDVRAELSRLKAELASETQRRLTFYGQVRDALGCGSRPMIEELPAEIAKLRAERDEAVERTLDAASEYMKAQYGLGALDHPTDRARVRAASLTKGGADV